MDRGGRIGVWIGAVAFTMQLGCGRAWLREDPWYTGSPAGYPHDAAWVSLEQPQILAVPPQSQAVAQSMLDTRDIVAVGPTQLETLGVGNGLGGEHMALVRGVRLNEGRFYVSTRGSHVHVHHRSMGFRPVRMKRVALVIATNEPVTTLTVGCSMAR